MPVSHIDAAAVFARPPDIIAEGGPMSYRLIEKQVVYDGKKVRLEVHHLVDEETGSRTKREVCVHPGAVVVLAFLEDGRILLVRNRRHAIGGQILLELPAGRPEKKEEPNNYPGRGLLEGNGYLA